MPERGHSSPSRRRLRPERVDDLLVLGRVDRADRIDDGPAGRTRSAARAGARAAAPAAGSRAPAQVGPRGEDAEPGARRVDERAVEAGQARRAARARRPRRRVTFLAPSRTTFARSSLARPACFSTATTSPASCVAFPPGAAQRSSVRSPSCDPTARPASCEPRLCGQMRPRAERVLVDAGDAERVREVGIRLAGRLARLAPVAADDRLRRLVLRAHERERILGPELAPPDRRATQSGYECFSAASSAVRSGSEASRSWMPSAGGAGPRS